MPENKDFKALILDVLHGTPKGDYSLGDTREALHNMILDYTGGATKVTRQAIRGGAFTQLFSVLEEVLPGVISSTLEENEFYKRFVEERRVGYGDVNRFVLTDSTLFEVSNIADGVGEIRRQRVTGPAAVSIATAMNGVQVYADEDQILGGKLDITDVILRVAKSVVNKYVTGALMVLNSLVADNLHGNFYTASGLYDQDVIGGMVEQVEADTGMNAVIFGTKLALQKLELPAEATASQEELAAMGVYKSWFGTPTILLNQRYLPGTKNFVFPGNTITIVAGDDKFIKLVREGDAIIDEWQPHDAADRTWQYLYRERSGIGIAARNGATSIARFTFA